MSDSALGRQLGTAIRQAMAEAAGYLALVTLTNPLGSADELLQRPDTDAVLTDALDQARALAEDLVRQSWYSSGDLASDDVILKHILDDIARIFDALAHLRGLVRHAHASVPRRRFDRGADRPGEHPSQRAAEERADAVRDAVLGWARQAALRARMAVSMASGAGSAAAVLADALRREEAGEKLLKRWRAHVKDPSCCFWCRRLNGVTIGLRESFVPYLGGPVALPQTVERHVVTKAGERQYGLPAGEKIVYTHPPHPYHGKLQGPLLHPFCRCWLEIVRAPGSAEIPSGGGQEGRTGSGTPPPETPAGFLAASDVRDMPEEQYQADLAFLRAAAHELEQVLKRLAEGG